MKHSFKVSGRSISFEESSPQVQKDWKFTVRPGGWIIAESLTTGERRRLSAVEWRGSLSIHSMGRTWSGQWQKKTFGDSSAHSQSDGDLTAQFPGKVRKILVAEGTQVQAGDSLVLVEAMKMEFSIRAPFAGAVEKIHVKEGQQLSPGDRFLDLKGGDNEG
jgi:biotin carboxyl carrier protein